MIIGTSNFGYPEMRTFAGLPFENIRFKKVFDICKVLDHLSFRFRKRNHPVYHNLFIDSLSINNVDKLHFFNTIAITKKEWIITFESYLPVWKFESPKVYRLLAKDNCKAIIGISDAAIHRFKYYLQNYPEFYEEICKKIVQIYPWQKVEETLEIPIKNKNKLVFCFVGNDFFRKGGHQVLQVLESFISKKRQFELHIASNFQYGDYASQTTYPDYLDAMRIINQNPNHFFVHERTDSEFYKKSHILLLPTLADTFGLSVLEAQANHCAVVTTDSFAMPEINNNEIGWLIETPKDEMRLGKVWNDNDRKLFCKIVCDKLESILQTVFDNPEIIQQKSILSFHHVLNQHYQDIILQKTIEIYDRFSKI